MSIHTTTGDETETAIETETETQIVEQLEGLVHYGAPTCKVCYRMTPDERPDEGEFSPDEPRVYVVGDMDPMCKKTDDGRWIKKYNFRCEHHDCDEHTPDEATHRAVIQTELDRDHFHNGAHRSEVLEVTEITEVDD